VTGFVVCGDGDVDELEGGVGIAESDDRDGDLGTLLQGLMVCSRVRCNDQARLHGKKELETGEKQKKEGDSDAAVKGGNSWGRYLFEGTRIVVGEGAGGKPSSDGSSADVGSKFQDSSLSIRSGTNDDDIGRVFDGCDDTSSKNNFLPGLSDVDDMDAIRATLPDIGLHMDLQGLVNYRAA